MTSARLTAGWLLIAVPILFTLAFTGLQMTFEYPDILRQPATIVLEKFAAGGPGLVSLWYAMTLAAIGFIPIAVGTAYLFWERDGFVAALAGVFGVLAGLVQALGLVRWVMLVPSLDSADPASAAIFDAANRYLGMGVGEHFGYLFTALWTVFLSMLIWRKLRWLAIAGLIFALGVPVGVLEPIGLPMAGAINAIGYSLWSLWLVVLGVMILRQKA